jgi:hypothetical protein
MLNRLQGVFACLEKHQVEYLVIGGIASILHGVPRATFDLDLLIRATPENAERLLAALLEAGLGTAALTNSSRVLSNEITIFNDRVRVDVQISTPGLSFEKGWRDRVSMEFEGQKFFVASKEDLISSKRAAGRPQDLRDVEVLIQRGS